jgi:molybdopterin-biosynthesis enzyme MoeA-like protein
MENKINLDELVKLIFQPGIPEEIKNTFFILADARTGSRFAYKLHCTMKEELGSIELELAQILIRQANKADDFYVQFWDSLYNYRPALALANMPEANDDLNMEAQAFQDFVNQYFSKEARAFVAGYLASKNL